MLLLNWLISFNWQASGCLSAWVWCTTCMNVCDNSTSFAGEKHESWTIICWREKKGEEREERRQKKAAESMTGCSIWCDKKIEGIEKRQCIINTQTHNETFVWKPRSSEVKRHYAFFHHHRLSLQSITSYSSLWEWIMTTNQRLAWKAHLSWQRLEGRLNRWLKIDCNVKNSDICEWGRAEVEGGQFFNGSDHVSPWVAACCQATKEMEFAEDEESLQWLHQLRCLFCINSSSVSQYHDSYTRNFNVQVLMKAVNYVNFKEFENTNLC